MWKEKGLRNKRFLGPFDYIVVKIEPDSAVSNLLKIYIENRMF